MLSLLIGGYLLLMAGIALHSWGQRKSSRWNDELESWQQSAQDLGLPKVESLDSGYVRLSGKLEEANAAVETDFDNIRGPITYCTIDLPGLAAITIEHVLVYRDVSAGVVLLGDPSIDEYYTITGQEPLVFALFDPELRKKLVTFDPRSLHVGGGRIMCEYAAHLREPEELQPRLRALLHLARKLSIKETDIGTRLLDNLKRETHLETRRRISEVLLKLSADLAKRSAELGLTDQDPLIRLRSALHLDDFQRALHILLEDNLPEEDVLLAYFHLSYRSPVPLASKVMVDVLTTGSEKEQLAVLRGMIAGNRLELAEVLVSTCAVAELSGTTWKAVTKVWEALGGSRAEPELLKILDSPLVVLVRLSAIRALGEVGSVRAVESLHAITRDFLASSVELREHAKIAILAIQSRLEGADRARLSLVDQHEDRGAVSYPSDEGALSLPPRKD